MTHAVHSLVQGSDSWHAFRAQHHGASEAAAMLGLSTKVTRTELLNAKHTGIAREFSDFVQERVLDHGHAVEALARPIIEEIIGESLYPVTCSKRKLSASCDGLTMADDKAFEHKQYNEALAAAVRAKELPDEYMPQCQQIMMVTGAEVVIFVVSDGTAERMEYMEVRPDQAWQDRITAGWAQFEADLAEFVPVVDAVKPTGRAPETLPALLIEISGAVQASNLTEFHGFALAVFKGINKDLQTDEDFADAEKTVRWCGDVEDRLEAAKQHALSQTASIDALFRTIDDISAEARRVRLDLAKLVEARKLSIKGEIVADGVAKLKTYIDGLNTSLGKPYMPTVPADFGGVIKGKRSVTSIRDAVATELARTKIAASDIANRIQTNLTTLREQAKDHSFLFSDTSTIVLKQLEDFQMLVKSRIAEHQAAEAAKEEATRARIQAEEQAKAEKAAREKIAAEQAAETETAAKLAKYQAEEDARIEALVMAAPIAPLTHTQVVDQMPATVRQAMAPKPVTDSAPTMTLGEISAKLGFNVTSAFLATLGFEATTIRAAKLYCDDDFPAICRALIEHIESVCEAIPA
jgi:putative phage-type endonuclease